MLAAHAGKGDYPKIRTFTKSDNSTNSVFRDLEAAELLVDISGKVDISELTWEQKERVLRFLFAKINGAREKAAPPSLVAPAESNSQLWITQREPEADGAIEEEPAPVEPDDKTFLTQAPVEDLTTGFLPQIPTN